MEYSLFIKLYSKCPYTSKNRSRSLLVLLCLQSFSQLFANGAEAIDFGRDVMPVLSNNCFSCHGTDANKREAKLRLDVRQNAIADRDGYQVIVPGDPEESLLMYMITSDDEEDRMPPMEKSTRLTDAEINILRQWIAEGANYEEHWAFVPVSRPSLPKVKKKRWPQSAIDHFVLARLESERLAPAKKASRETLVRRAFLDLTGLPPTPEQAAEFINNKSGDAWSELIESLLASPHYGERWGRHWLDVARYADSSGFETDLFFAHAWRFRDYVIRSFNQDKPFDRFIKEQIAGDELYPSDEDAIIATEFYTIGPMLEESGMVTGKLEYDQQTDFVDTTGAAFLGMTFGCARCHDHKYDPVSQKDYFGLQAIFAASDQVDFTSTGKKIWDRAAVKSTFTFFGAEQARLRALHQDDLSILETFIRENLDKFLGNDPEFLTRVKQTRRYRTLTTALDRYHRVISNKAASELSLTDKYTKIIEKDTSLERTFKEELVEMISDPTNDLVEAQLLELGVVLLHNPDNRTGFLPDNPKETVNRDTYDKLPDLVARRNFVLELGRELLSLEKPEDIIEDLDSLPKRLATKHLNDPHLVPIRILEHRDEPFEVRLLHRGELENAGDVVLPALPGYLSGERAMDDLPPNQWRTALANWIASDDNLLTARVIVNRVWQWHFGNGIVNTPNDFGIQGERPTHPELLDWLATEFAENGWSIKYLHRLIMSSSAYQMSANANNKTLGKDPDNRLLSRYQPRRMEAEAIWDNLLFASGKLNKTMYGIPFVPPLDEQELLGNYKYWPVSTPDESYRRAIYLMLRRSFRFPMLRAFDLPDNTASCGRRDITSVPNQALTLLNNSLVNELADEFAKRLLDETDGSPPELAKRAWQIAYNRPITKTERKMTIEFLSGEPVGKVERLKELCLAIFNTNEFIYLP